MAGLPKKETYNIHLAFRIITVAVNSAKISQVFCCNSYRDYKDNLLVCRRPVSISKLGQILILQTWSHDTWIEKHHKEVVSLLFIMNTVTLGTFAIFLFKKSWGHLQFLPPQQNYCSSLNLTKGQVRLRNDGHKRLHILQDNQKPGE